MDWEIKVPKTPEDLEKDPALKAVSILAQDILKLFVEKEPTKQVGLSALCSILATVLFGYIGRQLVLTTMLTWRGWSQKPAWFWRPFTIASLFAAAVAALFWPVLGGNRLDQAVYGDSLVYATLSYIVWSIALLPHTLVCVGSLIYSHFKDQKGQKAEK